MSTSANPLQGLSWLLPGLTGLAGAFPQTGNTSGSTSGSSTQTGTSSGTTTTNTQQLLQTLQSILGTTSGQGVTSTTPNLSPTSQAFINSLIQKTGTSQVPSLSSYVGGQVANINASSDAQANAVNNVMASRGLATSPVSGTVAANIAQNRINQINNVQANAPLQLSQLNLQQLQEQNQLASLLPALSGTTSTQQQTGTTSQQQTGSQQSSTFSSVAQLLNTLQQLQSQSQSQQQTQQGGGIGGLLGGLASGLAALL